MTDVAFHIAQYTNIIQELREEIMRLRNKLADPSGSASRKSHIADIQSVQCKSLSLDNSFVRPNKKICVVQVTPLIKLG